MWNGEIYGTIGPKCCDTETIAEMLKFGMTGMRLNLSHTTLEKSRPWIDALHEASGQVGTDAELLIDMQGPEVRIRHFNGTIELQDGSTVSIFRRKFRPLPRNSEAKPDVGPDSCGSTFSSDLKSNSSERTSLSDSESGSQISVDADIFSHFEIHQHLLLDDGIMELEIAGLLKNEAKCRVLRGGTLTGGKSLKIVGADFSRPALTAADLENIRLAGTFGVTALMQPFVHSGEELRQVRSALADSGNEKIRIFAKIEDREGMKNLDSILPEADMIVIARGDLGNDMPIWDLPAAQKEIEAICRAAGKPFLVVTQLLTSMISSPVPTRAEVSDIFNAVLDKADALMVTNETAVGSYPIDVIHVLKKTADSADKWMLR